MRSFARSGRQKGCRCSACRTTTATPTRHHRAQGLLLARRQAAGRLSRPQHRAFRLRRRRRPSAHGGRHAARSAHLRLARLRQPGRRVALPGTVRRAQPAGGAPDQHHGVRLRAADRGCAEGARRRVHRPRPHQRRAPRPDVGGRREALPRGGARRHREGLGQAAARLDGAVDESPAITRPISSRRRASTS